METLDYWMAVAAVVLYGLGMFFWGYHMAFKKAEDDLLELTQDMWKLKVELKELRKMMKPKGE